MGCWVVEGKGPVDATAGTRGAMVGHILRGDAPLDEAPGFFPLRHPALLWYPHAAQPQGSLS